MDVQGLIRPLGIGAALSVLLAVFASLTDRPVNLAAPPQNLIAGLQPKLAEATRLDVVHGLGLSGTKRLSFIRRDGQWLVTARQNYPAHQELVTETLLALADLQVLEARTAQPDWHRALGLVAPDALGKGVLFTVYGADATPMAELILGREEQSESQAVQQTRTFGPELRNFYVRRLDQAQSWLARGRLPRNPEVKAWLSPDLPRGPRPDLQRLELDGQSFDMTGAGGASWRDLFYGLRADDVVPRDDIAFATGRQFSLIFDKSLRLNFEVVGAATAIWLAARAEGPGAAQINDRFGDWAFRFEASAAPVLFPEASYLTAQ